MSEQNDKLPETRYFDTQKRHMNVSEVAAYLGLTRFTIFRMCKANEIPYTVYGKSIKRFDRVAIDEWVKKRTVPGRT